MKADVLEINGQWFAGCDLRHKLEAIEVPGSELDGADPSIKYRLPGLSRFLCCFWAGPFATEYEALEAADAHNREAH